ncbi:MAG: pyridoxamine 5'-phosphate oxidase family protein [Oscillospiraceae bacterium]|nr:pyridoxamine 5'-phosphate oxidase family protein [Oscillospiraceae bacterium]
MFREMRRNRQLLSQADSAAVLDRGGSGVLALSGDDGYPYAVPLSYVRQKDKLFFHCATTGHKLDALQRSDKASFCVIDQDQVVPEAYTTWFRSVIAFGRLRILEDEGEQRKALTLLAQKYAPEAGEEGLEQEIGKAAGRLCVLELSIEHMTGKEAIELVKARSSFS